MRNPVLIPISFWTTSLLNSTASSIPAAILALHPRVMDVSIETNTCRMRCDTTAPSLTVGVLLPKDLAPMRFEGLCDLNSNTKFQRTTGTCKFSAQFYKYVGD